MLNFISKMAASYIVKPKAKHTASVGKILFYRLASPDLGLRTVIFLHGLGDNGYGWSVGFEEIQEPHIKYIFPNAPAMPVTLNGGLMMPSWFDLYALSLNSKEDEAGIKKASDKLKELISEEEKLVPSNRIVIGGFSQGGALSMYTALTLPKQLGGLVCLSTYMPLHKTFPQALKWNSNTPVLQCHGEVDPLLSFNYGKMSGDLLKTFTSGNYEFKSYPGLGHSSSEKEMLDIKEWIKKVLPPKD